MTKVRTIDGIFAGAPPHWVGDGFWVRNYFPSTRSLIPKVSPFFFLDYHAPHLYPATEHLRRGVGPHPHRGLETVTIALEGSIAHHDSAGHSGVIGPGEAQWMTAGAGILHKEYHAASFARVGGMFHMLQLWVNLPKAFKMTPPKYQALTNDLIQSAILPHHGGAVRVLAGAYEGVQGPASTFSPLALYDVRLHPGGKASFSFPAAHNAAFLLYKGAVLVNGETTVQTSDLAVFHRDGETFTLESTGSDAGAIIMSGQPIDEPIVSRGPFLMNDAQEIQQAFDDFAQGKFGILEE